MRLPAMALTFVVLLLGSASGSPHARLPVLLGLLCIGVADHLFVYITNDLRDLAIDRTDQRRALSPLVAGTVRPWQALTIALAQLPIAVLVTAMMRGDAQAFLALGATLLLMTIYNLWGKRASFPPLTDLLQGLGWGALALYGAAISGRMTALTGVVFGFVVVLIVMANGVHGSLRDLPNDRRHGVRSTALVMGADCDDAGRLHVPRSVRTYAFSLQWLLTAIVLFPLVTNAPGYRPAVRWVTLGIVLLLGALAVWLLHAAASVPDTQRLRSAGTLQLTVTPMLPIVVIVPSVDTLTSVILIGGYVMPLVSFSWLPTALGWAWQTVTARSSRSPVAPAGNTVEREPLHGRLG